MSIETTKIELTKRILEVNDPELLERIKSMLPEKSADFWDDLTQEQQSEIELGLKLLDEGQSVDFDEFLKSQR
jgi:hypothetical protein